ncbi:MAG: GNAT family N-acetyltransferase [Planctomycetota bacterium]|jgi:GNAT superfamily N-acetyltransferase
MAEQKDISIRKFKSSDLAAVKKLIYATIDVCYTGVYPTEAVEFFKDWHCEENILKGAREGHAIVLEKGERIIGTGTLMNDEIVRVFVEPRWQGQGYGKTIMRRLEEQAMSLGLSIIKLDASLPSKRFYDALAYRTLEKTSLQLDNSGRLDYYKMEKSLAGA